MAVIKSGATSDQLTIDPTSKAARVSLYDAAGNAVASESGVDGFSRMRNSMMQSVFASTKNSSIAQINTGVEWTGQSETTLGVAAIQVNTYIDKTHQVTVYQSMDGVYWDITDVWTDPANYGNSRTVQATASYYKIGIKNLAGTNTGIVRIQTCLCPVVEALPRALTSGGNLRVTNCAEWQSTRRTVGLYGVSSFRTLGVAAGTQNLLTIENPASSLVNIAIRQMSVMSDSTVLLATVAQQIQLSRVTGGLPTNGTVLTAVKYQTAYSSPNAIVRGGTASDGGVATAITATASSVIWQQFLDRPHTVVGWFTHPNYSLIPDVGTDLRQIILVPGEALVVQGVTSIPTTTHMIVQIGWLEMTSL
jgi:hypothetical protein